MSTATEVTVQDPQTDPSEGHPTQHRRQYSQDFRDEAARMVVHGGERLIDVAARFSVSQQTLSNWVRKERQASRRRYATVPSTPAVREMPNARDRLEIERLRAELAREKERADTFEKTTILLARGHEVAS